ncbi:hypothetical protein IAI10_16700 [Clostridium sp. 19966]|uniref:hypothetical protein n=1 Tax=Clostridium sp. 19966 TaxID=2768166 RepID=UPI0028DED8AC|nr:hypothetical protein [Clostridium sp. 19966]MDT8718309.1 hypothetical protein [Clostridium sp. 19966]
MFICEECLSKKYKNFGIPLSYGVCECCKETKACCEIASSVLSPKKDIFKCNEDGVPEWCVAADKKQAYKFFKHLWGENTMKEYEDEYLEDNPNSILDDFIEKFFILEPANKIFTISDAGENGEAITKNISEWLTDIKSIPCYFCHCN